MKLAVILIIAGLAGYNFGLVIDAAANGDDSKLYSLAQTGQINSKWLPFALDDKILETNSYIETFPFGGGPYAFLETAFLLEENQVFDHATIDFTISIDTKPDGTFINRITECIFETDVDIDTECVVCLLKDWEGENIAKGEQFFTPPYLANTPLPLEMTVFLNDDEFITDVRNVKGIKIGICQEIPPGGGGDGEGCTPGYWRQTQHFGSWTDPPYSPDAPLTTYRAAFDLDVVPLITIKSSSGQGKAQTLTDTVGLLSDDVTLLHTIWAQGGGENKLARHATAALLNAANPGILYEIDLTEAEIKLLVQVAYGEEIDPDGNFVSGDFEDIGELFAIFNDLGDETCPLGLSSIGGP